MAEVSISAFAADMFHLERDLQIIQQSGADFIHVDVMDGHFVPLFGFHQPLIRQMINFNPICGDIHLMAEVTQSMLEQFLRISCRKLTLHVESTEPAVRLFEADGAGGYKPRPCHFTRYGARAVTAVSSLYRGSPCYEL